MVERNRCVIRVSKLLEPFSLTDRRWILHELLRSSGTMTAAERAANYRHRLSVTQCDDNVTRERVTEPTRNHHAATRGNGRVLRDGGTIGGFLKFWSIYPKRVGKGAASKAWNIQDCEEKTDQILEAVRKQRDFLERDNGKYVPNPATWLNQQRWEDEPPEHKSLARRLWEEGEAEGQA